MASVPIWLCFIWFAAAAQGDNAISVPNMQPNSRIVCEHSLVVLASFSPLSVYNVSAESRSLIELRNNTKVEGRSPAWLSCNAYTFQDSAGRWKQQALGSEQLSAILTGMLGTPTTQLTSGCWYSASPELRSTLPSAYVNVGLSLNGHYMAAVEQNNLVMLEQRNGSWEARAQLNLSTSDTRLNAPYAPLLVTNNGTVLLINQFSLNGVVARFTFNSSAGLALDSVASYYRFVGEPQPMRAALNHRQDTLLLTARLDGRLVPVSTSLPLNSFNFPFSMVELDFAWAPDDKYVLGLFANVLRTYTARALPNLRLEVVGPAILLPYRSSFGSIVVDCCHVYISLQANSTAAVSLYSAALDDDGLLVGPLLPLAVTGTVAALPLAACDSALLVPLTTGLQILRKTPLGPTYITTHGDIDWTRSHVVAVDVHTCQTTLWINSSMLTLGLGCQTPVLNASGVQRSAIPALQLLNDNVLLLVSPDEVSVAWSDDMAHLQHHTLLRSTGAAYQGVAAPAQSQGTYAVAVLQPSATVILGYQGTIQAVTALVLDAPFNMAFTNATTLAVAYSTGLHVYSMTEHAPFCSLSLVSETCEAQGPPLALLPAADNTLVVVRNADCDAVWVLTPDKGCYTRNNSSISQVVLGKVATAALNPTGSQLYMVAQDSASASTPQLYQLDLSTLSLLALHSIARLSPPFALAISTSLCALASADRVHILRLPGLAPERTPTGLEVDSELSIAADAVALSTSGSLLFAVQRDSGQLTTLKLRRWVRNMHACMHERTTSSRLGCRSR